MRTISRRKLLTLGVMTAGSQILPESFAAEPEPPALAGLRFLRPGNTGLGGIDSLKGEDLIKARLTPESWQVEIIGEGAGVAIEKPRKFDDGTALDYATLLELGKKHSVKFVKAMQCRGYNCPQGHAVWEGVPLREVVRLLGKVGDVLRVTPSGYHDPNNKKIRFHAVSASFTQVMENAPGDPPIILAYRLNGAPLPPRPWRPSPRDRALRIRFQECQVAAAHHVDVRNQAIQHLWRRPRFLSEDDGVV